MKQLQFVISSIFRETSKRKWVVGTMLVWVLSLMLAIFSTPVMSAASGSGSGGGSQPPPPPVAVIASPASNSNIIVGQPVNLVGNASSQDSIVSTSWSFLAKPVGSAAVITETSASGISPSTAVFTADIPGAYQIQFAATDPLGQTTASGIQLNAALGVPVANAGPDQSVALNSVVNLDGSGSTGVGPLIYQWSFTAKPLGSVATLSSSAAVSPTFTVDLPGSYTLKLSVQNAYGSSFDTVTISTINSKPVADAGSALSGPVGGTVTLDGSQSYDPDGDAITYQWILTTVPAGSAAALSNPAVVNPSLTLDKPGNYIAQLVVNDGQANSDPAQVAINTINSPPVANAGLSQSVPVGTLVTLDGSGSSDADNDSLSYAWSFTAKPAGSLAVLANATAVNPTFTPDLDGSYVVQLKVNDGKVDSAPSTVTVLATITQTAIINEIQNLQSTIRGLSSNVFKNKNMQKTLLNKLNGVIHSVQEGEYRDAISQLREDVLRKVNGCAAKNAPGKNDWITDCNAQGIVYPQVKAIIADIRALIPLIKLDDDDDDHDD